MANLSEPVEQRATEQQVDESITPTYAALVTYDPASALRDLDVTTLALFGSKDVQVDASVNSPLMRKLLARNRRATVRTVYGANHLVQRAVTGMLCEYGSLPHSIDSGVLSMLTDWAVSVTRP